VTQQERFMASQNGAIGEVARALTGVTLPAGKDDLAEFAHGTHPNDELVHLLAQLPDRKYATMAEIEEALAEAMRALPSSRSQDGRMAEQSAPRDPSSERLARIQPVSPDQLGAVRENQRSVESALDPQGLPQSERYGKGSGAAQGDHDRSAVEPAPDRPSHLIG
jgi:Protein of unknown function (DUF2795)